ncbi:hypothetical protein QM646_36615, partial [Rhodococcus erythropolis]|nr:hypothetical protein [Rhodococcus erythropolis]
MTVSENGDERRSFRGGGAPRSGGPRRDNDGRGSRGAAGGDRRGGAGDNNRGGAGNSNRGGGFNGGQRRGGEGGFTPRGRDGDRNRQQARPDEPDLPDNVEPTELDPAVRRDLLSLDKDNANTVARHLVMAGKLVDEDPELALLHARAARQRAGRIAVVREAAGITAYHAGEWAEALSELRAARRMAGGPGLIAVMADCERGLGRPERAIELGRSDE